MIQVSVPSLPSSKGTHLAMYTLLLLLVVQGSGSSFSDRDIQGFSDFLDGVISCRGVTGGVVTLVKDERVVLTKSFGYYDLERRRKTTVNTRFFIGSLTKAFTSAVIAKLLAEHPSYTWDTPIAHILGPSFRLANDLLSKKVNLRDVLAHKVGVPSNFSPLLVGFPENTTREDFVRMLGYQEPLYPLRTKFVYSNYMYVLAGFVAEKMGGKPWETLVRELLFEPLGMRDSGFVSDVQNLTQYPSAFAYVDGRLERVDQNLLFSVLPGGPAGSIYTTADDMNKWMNFNLGNGSISNGSVVIPDKFFTELHKEQMSTPFSKNNLYKPVYPISDMTLSYCLGWVSSVYRGYRKIWHSGGIVGYSSLLWLFPDLKAGVFVTITGAKDNQYRPSLYTIASQASDLLLGNTPWLNESTSCTFPAPWKDLKSIQHGNPQKPHPELYWNITVSQATYAGLYGHLAFGNMTITSDGDGILLHYGRFGRLRLLPINEQLFLGYFIDSLSFTTNSDGNTEPLVIEFKFNALGAVESIEFPVDLSVPKKTSFKRIDKFRSRYTRNYSVMTKAEGRGVGTFLSVTAAWCLFH